jgi:hypothetical protein
MANRLILVPETVYRGLTSNNNPTESSDPNLDFTRRELYKVLRSRAKPDVKNIRLNQQLHRYLALRNERENRPVKVQMLSTPKGTLVATTQTPPAQVLANAEEAEDMVWTNERIALPAAPQPAIQAVQQHALDAQPSSSAVVQSQPKRNRALSLDEHMPEAVRRRQWARKQPTREDLLAEVVSGGPPPPPPPPPAIAVPQALEAPPQQEPEPIAVDEVPIPPFIPKPLPARPKQRPKPPPKSGKKGNKKHFNEKDFKDIKREIEEKLKVPKAEFIPPPLEDDEPIEDGVIQQPTTSAQVLPPEPPNVRPKFDPKEKPKKGRYKASEKEALIRELTQRKWSAQKPTKESLVQAVARREAAAVINEVPEVSVQAPPQQPEPIVVDEQVPPRAAQRSRRIKKEPSRSEASLTKPKKPSKKTEYTPAQREYIQRWIGERKWATERPTTEVLAQPPAPQRRERLIDDGEVPTTSAAHVPAPAAQESRREGQKFTPKHIEYINRWMGQRKWAARKPTQADAWPAPKKINWAARKPTQADAYKVAPRKWATKRPTKEQLWPAREIANEAASAPLVEIPESATSKRIRWAQRQPTQADAFQSVAAATAEPAAGTRQEVVVPPRKKIKWAARQPTQRDVLWPAAERRRPPPLTGSKRPPLRSMRAPESIHAKRPKLNPLPQMYKRQIGGGFRPSLW